RQVLVAVVVEIAHSDRNRPNATRIEGGNRERAIAAAQIDLDWICRFPDCRIPNYEIGNSVIIEVSNPNAGIIHISIAKRGAAIEGPEGPVAPAQKDLDIAIVGTPQNKVGLSIPVEIGGGNAGIVIHTAPCQL